MLLNLHVIIFFSFLFLWLFSSFMPLWSEEMLEIISKLSDLLRLVLYPSMWSNLRHVPCVLEKNEYSGASLVAQWLGICLPMQGTRVRTLTQEDHTCHGATKPV